MSVSPMNSSPMSSSATPLIRSEPSVRLIAECAATRFGILYSDLISSKRLAKYVKPRQVAMHLARRHTSQSYPEIGARLGGRDHTTVMHGERSVARMLAEPIHEIVQAVQEIEVAIGCGNIAIERTGAIIFSDTDIYAAASRILDVDAVRISADEVRAMAGFIRQYSLPLVEHDEPTVFAETPKPVLSGPSDALHLAVKSALKAYADFQNNEFSQGEKSARATLAQQMQALAFVTKEN